MARNHILQSCLNGAQLVIGFGVREAGAEGVPHARRRIENGRFAQCAFGGHTDKTLRHLSDALFKACLLGLPCAATQPIEEAFLVTELAEELDVFNR